MKQTINLLRKKAGYVSIEMVVIGGLIVGLGAGTISNFNKNSAQQVQNSVNVMQEQFTSDTFPGILD